MLTFFRTVCRKKSINDNPNNGTTYNYWIFSFQLTKKIKVTKHFIKNLKNNVKKNYLKEILKHLLHFI